MINIPAPRAESLKSKSYVTYRRFWLDHMLAEFSKDMRGTVIDLAGKREKKRGSFQPPENQAQAWWYINIDRTTVPNIYADVTRTPFVDRSVDCILCTEVLEHLPNPQACVDEMYRLLGDGGVVFASTPFFYPVHADPDDFQRFTEDGLRYLFRGFRSVEVYRMGGYAGVLGLLFELGIPGEDGNSLVSKILRWAMKWISRGLCWLDLSTFDKENINWHKFTTGYFLRAVR
jgi:SAM-dependent methyltransferase